MTGTRNRGRLIVLIVLIGACLAWPVIAAAQTTTADTPPAGTVVLGPVWITPGLALTNMGVDNNVFNENDDQDPKSDFTFTLTPKAAVRFRMRRLRLGFDFASDYVYFQTYKSEGGTNNAATIRADVDLGRFRPYASVRGLDTKVRRNAEVDARARHHETLYTVGASLLVASRTNLVGSATRSTLRYNDDEEFRGVDLGQSLDGSRNGFEGGASFELTPLTTLTVTGGVDQDRFVYSPDRNSDSWRFGPSLRFTPDGVVTGTASIGFRHFDASSPDVPDYSGLTSAIAVGATIYGRHKLEATLNRDVQYSYDTAADYYVSTDMRLTWTMVVVGPFDIRAMGGRTLMDYPHQAGFADAHDTASSYGGGVGYRFTARARIGVDAEWMRRSSNISSSRDYTNRRLLAGLTWGITP